MRSAVPHVALTGRIGVQAGERRRENRIVNASRRQIARQFHGITKLHLPSLALFDSRCVGNIAAAGATVNLAFVQFVHVVHHLLGHLRGVALFALDVLGYRAFVRARYDVAVHFLLLAESPTTSDSLIELLVGIRQSEKYYIRAMLPVHSPSADRRLSD